MDNLENTEVVEEEAATEFTEEVNDEVTEETAAEVSEDIEDTSAPTDYVDKDEEEEDDEKEDSEEDPEDDKGEDDDDEEEKAKKYELLEEEFNTLKEQYSVLQSQYQELVNFKNEIDNQNKDALIAEFYMLSDEDKADVISNKEKYTLDEIKAKLSVICFDKKISFTLDDKETESKDNDVMTYTYGDN